MSNTTLATIKIDELSKFGFKSNGEYINWSKTLKDDQKVNVVPGRTFQMELYVADSGKKYVNKVMNMVNTADVPAKVHYEKTKSLNKSLDTALDAVEKAKSKLNKHNTDLPMTRTDWDAKDRRISRQGVIQAAVNAVASQSTLEDLFTNAEMLANQMLKFVNE